MGSDATVIYYDGHCMLCSRIIRFVARHDHKKLFRFAYLESPGGQRIAKLAGEQYDSVILWDNGKIYTRSDAVLRVMQLLGGAWKLMGVGHILPRPVRNALYDLVARNRYKWFGKSEKCVLPSPEFRSRMTEHDIQETL